jgi:hypothetical protein
MSKVTWDEINQLTHRKGVTSGLKLLPNGKAFFVNGGTAYVLDIDTRTTWPLQILESSFVNKNTSTNAQ